MDGGGPFWGGGGKGVAAPWDVQRGAGGEGDAEDAQVRPPKLNVPPQLGYRGGMGGGRTLRGQQDPKLGGGGRQGHEERNPKVLGG